MALHTLNYLKFNSVLKCAKELSDIAEAENEKKRKILIKKARECVINAISEIAVNCLKGNFPLKNCDFNKLKKYKKQLIYLSKSSPINKRKKYLIQKGGFLNLLIPPALSFIGSLVYDLLRKKVRKNVQKNETRE